jgi:hypothetical protein
MKQYNFIFIVLLLIFFPAISNAQQGVIKGTVTDSETGRLLKDVNITGASGKSLFMTDESGSFQFSAEPGNYIFYLL